MNAILRATLLAFASLCPASSRAFAESAAFEGKTAEQWAAAWAADINGFRSVAERWGLDGIPHFAKLLTLDRPTNEVTAALQAIETVLRDPVVEKQRRMAEDVAVPAMLPLLQHPKLFMRGRCMSTLVSIGSSARAAVPGVLAILRDTAHADNARFNLRGFAAGTLGAIGKSAPEEVIPALCETLEDQEPGLRQRALAALGHLGWRATTAIPAIEKAMAKSDEPFRKEAEAALAAIRRPRPAQAGDALPSFQLPQFARNATWGTEDARGSVVVLEFWSASCGPCQPAMAKFEDMANKRADWRGKVALVAINEDETAATGAKHAAERGWKSMTHLHDEGARVRKLFHSTLPEIIMADRTGKVVWRGHPMEISMEKEVDRLLQN